MNIYVGNAYQVEYIVQAVSPTTGALVPATGLALTARISASRGGAAIGSLSVALTEAVSAPGTYLGVLSGAQTSTDLAAYVGQTVWEVLVDGGGDLRSSTAVAVVAEREV